MKVAYFTERPYRWISEDEVLMNHAFFEVSNKHFDREYAKELDLPDPYERTPGVVKTQAGAKRTPVVDRRLSHL